MTDNDPREDDGILPEPIELVEAPKRARRKKKTGITHNTLSDPKKRKVRMALAVMLRETGEPGVFEYVEPGMNDDAAAARISETLGFPVVKTNVARVRMVEEWKLREAPVPRVPKGALSLEQVEQLSRLPFIEAELNKLAEGIRKLHKQVAVVDGWEQVVPRLQQEVERLKAEVVNLERTKVTKIDDVTLARSHKLEKPVIGTDKLTALRDKYKSKE